MKVKLKTQINYLDASIRGIKPSLLVRRSEREGGLKEIFSRAIVTALAILMSACNFNAEEIFDAKCRNLEIQLV
jgi:hypothetical protein